MKAYLAQVTYSVSTSRILVRPKMSLLSGVFRDGVTFASVGLSVCVCLCVCVCVCVL